MKKVITKLALACISSILVVLFAPQNSAAIDPEIDPGTIAGMWLFDEGQGDTAIDSSGNGNDGAIMGPQWVAGKSGGALQFNGSGDYVDCGDDDSLDLTEQLTIVAWMKEPPGSEGYIIIRNNPDDSIRQWGFVDYTTNGSVSLFCNTVDGGREEHHWAGSIDDDTWHHVALTVNNINAEVFVDGVSRGIKQLGGTLESVDDTVWIGKRKPDNARYTGILDEIAVFNVALSVDDINSVMNDGLARLASAVSPAGKLGTSWAKVKEYH